LEDTGCPDLHDPGTTSSATFNRRPRSEKSRSRCNFFQRLTFIGYQSITSNLTVPGDLPGLWW